MRRKQHVIRGLAVAVASLGSLVLVAACGGNATEVTQTVTETVAVTETVTVTEAESAAAPAIEPSPDALIGTVALEPAQQTKNGVTMSLTRLTGTPGSTHVDVRITNFTEKICFFSDYAAALTADGGQPDRFGETGLVALAKHANAATTYGWEREIPADTSVVRFVARAHCGSFTHGRHLLFDIETGVRPS
jgi:hypothetical protein